MSRRTVPPRTIPIVAFARGLKGTHDPLAVCLTASILLFLICMLSLPVSRTVQAASARRFQLAGWPFLAWATFQPLPSMYNFENRWDVVFTPSVIATTDDDCRLAFHGFINHHVFNRVLLQRVALERCGLPANVRFRTEYRGTIVESRYVLTSGPGTHGFIVTPQPE